MKPSIQFRNPFAVSVSCQTVRRLARPGIVWFGVAGLLTIFSGTAQAASDREIGGTDLEESLPSFIFQPVYASNEGSVYGVYEARHADLVLLRGGFDSGFRTGMVCRVADGEAEVGEVMLVEVRNNCAAGIILHLESGKIIEEGHSVRIKTVKF